MKTLVLLGLLLGGHSSVAQVKDSFRLDNLLYTCYGKDCPPAKLTTKQMQAIKEPSYGLLIYNKDEKQLRVFDGKKWITLTNIN